MKMRLTDCGFFWGSIEDSECHAALPLIKVVTKMTTLSKIRLLVGSRSRMPRGFHLCLQIRQHRGLIRHHHRTGVAEVYELLSGLGSFGGNTPDRWR